MTRWMWGGVLTACLAISGCSGLGTLSRATAPTDLYTLTPKSTFSSGLPRISQQLLVSEPTASSAVNTDQVAVQPTPYQFEYLPRARWVDRAPVMLQTLLIESYENSGKVAAVGRSSVGLRPDYLIVSDLREFQARIPKVETEEVALEVHVMLNMKIVDNFDDRIIGSKSFEEILYAPSDDMDDVVLVFDNALGKAMRKSVEWSVKTIYSHQQRNPRPDVR